MRGLCNENVSAGKVSNESGRHNSCCLTTYFISHGGVIIRHSITRSIVRNATQPNTGSQGVGSIAFGKHHLGIGSNYCDIPALPIRRTPYDSVAGYKGSDFRTSPDWHAE